ncbi:hypothetical protein FOZ63_001073 [Perkinsus olseni]|uniref:Uncharacterized protein n=1 Tax=Perkinsus olseni TaxID=32597 RepID=A0A7J6TMQ5_PEROL|nr:hypothetical protein FOZ63_001073 [Perkinsus olseni]
MPVEPVCLTGSASAVKAKCVLPLKTAAVGAGSQTAAASTTATAAVPTPEMTSFAAAGPPEITNCDSQSLSLWTIGIGYGDVESCRRANAYRTQPPVTIPSPPELKIPPDILANVQGLANAIRLPQPTAFTGAPGTYHEFPEPGLTPYPAPQVGQSEARTLSKLGRQDLVDTANEGSEALSKLASGVPSFLFLSAVAPSAVNGMLVPVFEAIRATCDTNVVRRVVTGTYTIYAEAWFDMSLALHEIMAELPPPLLCLHRQQCRISAASE